MATKPDVPAAENELSSLREELRNLRLSLDQNDAEIDELQTAAQRANRPWYRDITAIIALSAFLFSLLTTTFSYRIARQQEIHDNKSELRGLLQRINTLNIEYTEFASGQGAQFSGPRQDVIVNELVLLANQADELMQRIPPDFLSTIEYVAVAKAFYFTLNHERAEKLFVKATEAAQTPLEEARALREYGNFLKDTQQPAEARKAYEQALLANQKMSTAYQMVAQLDALYTHWNWALFELGQSQCASAREHSQAASAIAVQWLPPTSPVAVQIASLSKSVEACQNP